MLNELQSSHYKAMQKNIMYLKVIIETLFHQH